MKPKRLNVWLTLFANFGVIAGLIFLGLEVRQNTIATQATAIQESTNVARQQLLMLATNPDLVELNLKASRDLNELNEVEVTRIRQSGRSYWLGMQGLWRQWTMGVLPNEEWEMWNQIICNNYARTAFWPQTLIPSFIELVESCEIPE